MKILLDIGGVLAIPKREELDERSIYVMKQIKKIRSEIELGESYTRKLNELNQETSQKINENEYINILSKGSEYNADLVNKIKNEGFEIYLFSNIFPELFQDFENTTNIKNSIQGKILSYEIKTRKPQPEFYKKAIDIIQDKPENCIIIDDDEKNIEAGKELNFKGIVYKNNEQTLKEITEYIK